MDCETVQAYINVYMKVKCNMTLNYALVATGQAPLNLYKLDRLQVE